MCSGSRWSSWSDEAFAHFPRKTFVVCQTLAMSKSKPTAKVKPPKPALVVESSLVPAPRLSRGRTRESAILPVAPALASLPADYASLLTDIKKHIVQARLRTVLAANVALIRAYWHIGHTILSRQKTEGWGARVIDRLSADLRETFPEMRGLSPRNLLAMKVFAREFPQAPIAQQPVAQLPWGHILQLMQKVNHLKLRRYVVIEIKAVPFDPGFAGTMNFYLSAVDDLLRHPDDQPTIGLLLCKSKDKLEVEYALRGFKESIAVSEWQTQLTETLPHELQSSLPTIAEIEAELAGKARSEKKP